MNRMTVWLIFLGLAFTLGTPAKSEALCLVFCDDSDEVAVVDVEESAEVTDSSISAGEGNTTAVKNSNTVVIGGSIHTTQSNHIGGIGVNHGDIIQSNSANITGQQNSNVQGNNMRSSREGSGDN